MSALGGRYTRILSRGDKVCEPSPFCAICYVFCVLRLGLVTTRVFGPSFPACIFGSLAVVIGTNPHSVFHFVEVCPKVLECRFPGVLTSWNPVNEQERG